MIKIGQVGIGHNHGAAKMESIRKFPHIFEVVGYAPESEAWREERSGLPAYEELPCMDIEALLEKCDAVMVETEVPTLTAITPQ